MTTATYSSPIQSIFATNPLTTTFSAAPSTCSGIYSSGGVAVIDTDTACLPSGFATASTDYFSPGIACPAGYVTACHDNEGVASITTVTCCPVRSGITLNCVTPSTLSDVWATLFCTWIAPEDVTSVLVTDSNDGGTTSTVAVSMSSPGGLNALGVRMVYESSDLATTTSGTTVGSDAGSTATSTGEGSSTATSGSGSASNSNAGGNGLSTGATVGIAVVVALVGIAAVIGVFFWMRKKKQRQQLYGTLGPDSPAVAGTGTDPKAFNGYYDPKTTQELSSLGPGHGQPQALVEVGQENRPSELPHHYVDPVEMPGSEGWTR